MAANEKKDRPLSTVSDTSNYIEGSDYATYATTPLDRPSRPSKKIHNFGKRSNSIRRNPSAPVIKRNWLYKQDSTGMKLWKKRWFVLSDLCLFYYRDEKEEGILGSILLPSFFISTLSIEDHVNRKHAFKATHPNMRTYYFCTDTAKEMESWMRVMTDAALVHEEVIQRMDKLQMEQCGLQETNHVTNQRQLLTEPETHNNECNEAKDEHIDAVRLTSTHVEERKTDFPKNGSEQDCKLQPVEAEAIQANMTPQLTSNETDSPQVNGSVERRDNRTPAPTQQSPAQEADRNLSRTSSRQQLEMWVRTQRGRIKDDDTRSVSSYQTLPRNSSGHWAPFMPQYGDGYRSMPRNSMAQRDSICSLSPSLYEQALWNPMADKRRSMRDDTLWQLYEWQQRQAYNRQPDRYSMSSPKTMINLSEHVPPSYSIPASPSHGSLSMYGLYSPMAPYNISSACSEFSSPLYSRDMGVDMRLRHKHAYPPDRRSMPVGIPIQPITSHSLQRQSMSSEDYRDPSYLYMSEDVNIDIKLSRLCEQDKLVRIQDDKVQQLYREKHTMETALLSASQEIEMGSDNLTSLQSVVQQRDLLQRGLLSTCRELSRVTAEMDQAVRKYDRMEGEVTLTKNNLLEKLEALENPQTESLSQHRLYIQKQLWQIEDVMEALNKHKAQRNAMDAMGFYGPKVSFNKHNNEEDDLVPPRPPLPQSYQPNTLSVPPLPSTWQPSSPRPEDHKNNTHTGSDYRLYKSEPELTTVTEVDENNGEERTDHNRDRQHPSHNGMSHPVGIVPPRTKSPVTDSSSIPPYVTLRKNKNTDPRVGRPHSAVEQQLCSVESGRPRMSVEEQLERIRRHQQGALRGKKKNTRSHSFTKLKHFHKMQMSSDIQELEASFRKQQMLRELETPAEEIARLKDLSQSDHFNVDRELSVPDKVLIPERYIESEPEETLSPEQEADKQKKVDRIKALIAKNSIQNLLPSTAVSCEEEVGEEVMVQEKHKMINISYELAAEASKRSKLVAAQALASVKSYM